ncbi:MAG TPA: branched-chain amino acid ABC transporter permease, partial [Xanthobacteraceae bacterium]|nr:branched-chain amino acid ABC transporter permease [Xanthobacteraceae bacterium]
MVQAALTAPPAARRSPLRGNALPLAIFLILALTPLFAVFGAQAYVLSLVTRVMIFAIAALALDLLVGYGALVSFGHAAFVGLGAYAIGILSSHGITEILVAL